MTVIKSFFIAFSIYSKIPVFQFEWKEEDMKYTFCFFPWVGAVIGILLYLWGWFCISFSMTRICYACVGTAIPLLISGGFHVDGFMDTMDAFRSYQSRERKLEILKDSHIGAFSVIMLCLCGLLYIGAFSEIQNQRTLSIVGAGFFLSRALSALSALTFPTAKKEGSLYFVRSSAQKKIVIGTLILQSAACMIFMLWRSLIDGAMIALAAFIALGYYYYRSKKEFGGISGDTAGYYVVLSETCMVVTAALINVMLYKG